MGLCSASKNSLKHFKSKYLGCTYAEVRVKNVDLSETFFAATEHEMHHVNAGRWKEQKPIFEPPVSNCAYFKNTALIDLPQRFHEIGQTGWKFHIEERIFAAKKCYSSLSSGPTQFFFDLIIE